MRKGVSFANRLVRVRKTPCFVLTYLVLSAQTQLDMSGLIVKKWQFNIAANMTGNCARSPFKISCGVTNSNVGTSWTLIQKYQVVPHAEMLTCSLKLKSLGLADCCFTDTFLNSGLQSVEEMMHLKTTETL